MKAVQDIRFTVVLVAAVTVFASVAKLLGTLQISWWVLLLPLGIVFAFLVVGLLLLGVWAAIFLSEF